MVRRNTKKIFIGIAGGLVTLIGLILVPYPGPGWLIVFGGLAILATEFKFAKKVLDFAKGKYDTWVAWIKRQNIFMKILILGVTGAVVILTLWLLNTFGLINTLFGWSFDWAVSPFFR